MWPQNVKNLHFLVVALRRQTLWLISKISTGFFVPNYPALVFQIW